MPFDPWRKRLTVVYAERRPPRVFVKGAPETLLERARISTPDGAPELLDATELGGEGCACSRSPSALDAAAADDDDLDADLQIVGLVGAPRPAPPGGRRLDRARPRRPGIERRDADRRPPGHRRAIGHSLGLEDRSR